MSYDPAKMANPLIQLMLSKAGLSAEDLSPENWDPKSLDSADIDNISGSWKNAGFHSTEDTSDASAEAIDENEMLMIEDIFGEYIVENVFSKNLH